MNRKLSKDRKDDIEKDTTAKQGNAAKCLVISNTASPKGKSKAAKSSLRDAARRIIEPVGPVLTGKRSTRGLSTKYDMFYMQPIRRMGSAAHNYTVDSDFDISMVSVASAIDPSWRPNRATPRTLKPPTKKATARVTTARARHSAPARLQKSPALPKETGGQLKRASANVEMSAPPVPLRRQKKAHVYDQMNIMSDEEVPQPAAKTIAPIAAPIVTPQNSPTCSDDSKLFVVMNENDELFINGTMELQLLYGKIFVFGHIITNTENTYKMYVPRGTSQFSIKNIFSDKMTINTRDSLRRNGLGMHQLTTIRGGESVILCRNISNDALHNTFRTYFTRDLFPGDMWCQLRDKIELSLDTEQQYVMDFPSDWDDITSAITDSSRVFFAGDKGTGKSTMLRYFVNHLLNRFPAVNVIDLDPGQSEFTIGGCISATVVTEPLFGPSYTHLKTPNICVPVRLLNGRQSDDGYLPKVRYLVARSEIELEQTPTLINYMGYTRLNAIKLVASVIAITKPTVLIQLQQTMGGKNYECTLNAANVVSILNKYNISTPWDLDYEVHVLNTAVTCQPKMSPGFQMTPKENRELNVIAYFSKLFNANVQYIMDSKIRAIRVGLCHVTLLYQDDVTTPDVVNAELVMLCEKVSEEVGTFRCRGWGIVKYINVKNEFLYLITPLIPDDLGQVKYLMMGTIKMPLTFHTKCNGERSGSPIPYVSRVEAIPLNLPPKRVLYNNLV